MNENENWIKSLDEEKRLKVFQVMIDLGQKCFFYIKKEKELTPPFGTTPVGNASFEWFLKQEVTRDFLQNIRNGLSPAVAEEKTKEYSREIISKNNEKWKKEMSAIRWEGSGDATIESCSAMIRNSMVS
jgi:hypothetical protein